MQRFAISRRFIVSFLGLVLLVDAVLLGSALSLTQDQKVLLRNVFFSSIYSDSDLPNEQALDAHLRTSFKIDAHPEEYLRYLDRGKAQELRLLSEQRGVDDRTLAVAISDRLGPVSHGDVCGLDSLDSVVFDTERGIGCCSDASKAWMFYALYLGMTVREVDSENHTTVEYLDRKTHSWQWIDPFNRVELLNAGKAVTLYGVRMRSLFEPLEFSTLRSSDSAFDPAHYPGYAPSQLGVVMWRLGTNFLEIDRWDARLRVIGMPKSLRQMILLATGMQPGWLMLATNSLAVQLRALKILMYITGFVLALANLLALFGASVLGIKAAKTRARVAARSSSDRGDGRVGGATGAG